MSINQKENIPGCNRRVWFSRRAITNIISLKNITGHYRVTYYSNDHLSVIHREVTYLPNMEFLMHNSVLNWYEPTKKDLVFLNTVSKNKVFFCKRKIKSAIKAQELQHTLVFLTVKEVKWIIKSNHIQYCPVETEYVENAELIWLKDVRYLKGGMTRKKPIRLTEDIIRVPKKFLKINKDALLPMDIFFVNKIPFLITLSRNIDFTAPSHLTTQTSIYIFKYFWRINVFYLKCGFRITTLHADGEFATLQ